MFQLDVTHDPTLKSWVASANAPECDFPIQNLPFGIFRPCGSKEKGRPGIAIGECIADLRALHMRGLLKGKAGRAVAECRNGSLNGVMSLGPKYWTALRLELSKMLSVGFESQDAVAACLWSIGDADMLTPAKIGNFTDFMTSINHAMNVGRLFHPDVPVVPNFRWMPIAVHGRASSVKVSGTPCRRPLGQIKRKDSAIPDFGPSSRLDLEVEVGLYVGPGNELGEPIALEDAESHAFGLSLLNDWSARDFHVWEAQPLGPFLGKNFLTTVSPWVVTMEALAPYRTPTGRPETDPPLLRYLNSDANNRYGGIDITVEAYLQTQVMREARIGPAKICSASFGSQYWSVFQMLTHHASNGCNLVPGDLLGSGTISGAGAVEGKQGCLLERTHGGSRSFELPSGEVRTWLEDGDEVILRGYCRREGAVRIGFGECVGRVVPARKH